MLQADDDGRSYLVGGVFSPGTPSHGAVWRPTNDGFDLDPADVVSGVAFFGVAAVVMAGSSSDDGAPAEAPQGSIAHVVGSDSQEILPVVFTDRDGTLEVELIEDWERQRALRAVAVSPGGRIRVAVGDAGTILVRQRRSEVEPPDPEALCVPRSLVDPEFDPPDDLVGLFEDLDEAGIQVPSVVDLLEEQEDFPVQVCGARGDPGTLEVSTGEQEGGILNPAGVRPCAITAVNPEFPCLREFEFAREDGEALLDAAGRRHQQVQLMLDSELRRLVGYASAPPRVFLFDVDRLEQRGVPGFGKPFDPASASAGADSTGVANLRHSEALSNVREFPGAASLDSTRHRLFIVGSRAGDMSPSARTPQIAAVSLIGEFEPTVIDFEALLPGVPPHVLAETKHTGLAIDVEHNLVYVLTEGPRLPSDHLVGAATSFGLVNAGVTLHALRPTIIEDEGAGELVLERQWALALGDRCPRTQTSRFQFMGVSGDGRTITFPCTEVSFTHFGVVPVVPGSILNVLLPEGRHPSAIGPEHAAEFGFRSDAMPGSTAGLSVVLVRGAPGAEVLHWRTGSRHFFWHYGRREWIGGATIDGRAELVAENPAARRLYLTGGDITGGEKGQPGMLRLLQTVNVPMTTEHAHVATGLGDFQGQGVVDPLTARLFVLGETGTGRRMIVLEDRVSPTLPRGLDDPDAFTRDIDQTEADALARRGETQAYGARVWWTGFEGALPGSYLFGPGGTPVLNVTQLGDMPPGYTYRGLRGHVLLGPSLSSVPWQPHHHHRAIFTARVEETRLDGGFTGTVSSAEAGSVSVDGNTRGDATDRRGAGQVRESVEAQGGAACGGWSDPVFGTFGLPSDFSNPCREFFWDALTAEVRGDPVEERAEVDCGELDLVGEVEGVVANDDAEPADTDEPEWWECAREDWEEARDDEDWNEWRARWREERERLEGCSLEFHDRVMRELDGQRQVRQFGPDGRPRADECFSDFDGRDPDWDEETRENEREGLEERLGWSRASSCADPGATDRSFRGSVTVCDIEGWRTEASAQGGFAFDLPGSGGAASSVRVGSSSSGTQSFVDSQRGMVSEAVAVASDVEVVIPGRGTLSIGEVRTTASSWAGGRPGTAGSEFDVGYQDVRITDDPGDDKTVLFSCGPSGVTAGDQPVEVPSQVRDEWSEGFDDWPDDAPVGAPELPGDPVCDPDAISEAVSLVFGQTLQASAHERDLEQMTTGSPGGAQAIVRRNRSDFSADLVLFNVTRFEVPGLQLTVNADGNLFNRFKVDLAAVFVESGYQIGQPRVDLPVAPPAPGSLVVELSDHAGVPLAGGVFEVSAVESTSARRVGECRTASDGVGGCRFPVLPPGSYEVRQVAAPTGYAPQEGTARVFVSPGSESTARFVNVRNAGGVQVTLVNPAGEPLSGGAFDLAHDESGTAVDCTTGEGGACVFSQVPLGGYRLVQTAAPEGYEPAEPVEFTLVHPGQVASITVVNGRPGAGATGSTVRIIQIIDDADPIVSRSRLGDQSPFGMVRDALADAWRFALHNPLQALVFALLMGLFVAPAYLYWRSRRYDHALSQGALSL